MSSQVVTLYEDKAKTNALYPRTKLSAISDDDGKALSETIDELNSKVRINYLRPTYPTVTQDGITLTNNGNGTFTVNGTATQNCSLFVSVVGKIKDCKLVGCPINGVGSYLVILPNGQWNGVIKDQGNGSNKFSLDTEKNYVGIAISSGVTVNNLVFKPMITDDLSATYDDFVPYDDSLVTGSSQYFFGGIDTSMLLLYVPLYYREFIYIATEDCFVTLLITECANTHQMKIDDVTIIKASSDNDIIYCGNYIIPLKKGQVFYCSGKIQLYIYGVKR